MILILNHQLQLQKWKRHTQIIIRKKLKSHKNIKIRFKIVIKLTDHKKILLEKKFKLKLDKIDNKLKTS